MAQIRPYFEEVMRALLVLALVLLNLANAPAPAVAHDGFAFTSAAIVFCGDDGPDGRFSHAPCHACRVGTDVALPPPPCDAAMVILKAVPVIYSPAEPVPQDNLDLVVNRNRGPPPQA